MLSLYLVHAFQDNIIWVGRDSLQASVVVVDPGDATPVLAFLRQHQLTLTTILITHKHYDHVGGLTELLSFFPKVTIFSHPTEDILQTTHQVSDQMIIPMGDTNVQVITIPGHTLGHVAYYAPPFLFCGDTLFSNGCGRIFEGTAEQMLCSLKKLMKLPDDTKICCGHDYTLANIQFARQVEPRNVALIQRLKTVQSLQSQNRPTLPSTLQMEKATNPFLRCHLPVVIDAVSRHVGRQLSTEVEVFAALRQWKDELAS